MAGVLSLLMLMRAVFFLLFLMGVLSLPLVVLSLPLGVPLSCLSYTGVIEIGIFIDGRIARGPEKSGNPIIISLDV